MKLDRDRLAEVLAFGYSYYEGPEPDCEIDDRFHPATVEFIASQVDPTMAVLDLGCGDGDTLLRNSHRFSEGVGIDNDPAHIALATAALKQTPTHNVSFHAIDVDELPQQPWRERFDFVFSERGPLGYDVRGVQAALSTLRAGGLIFAEVIGDLHHQEVREIFGGPTRLNQLIRTTDQVRVAMERNGVTIRIAADLVSKRTYPNIYEWLKFQCSIWSWIGYPFPDPADPRLELFAQRNANDDGRIDITHHVVWVGGVKSASPTPYHEYQHFG